ncbi:MAG: ribose 5-phosphate isomerase B [Bacteroidales bacterium]|nr:ribose 5-phosphate isomerase B [Bacteroidales bacterium]
MKKIAFACDHAGFETKEFLIKLLKKQGYETKDFGTYSSESVDYPDYAHPMAKAVENKEYDFGISLCGSGNGINMTANKHQGIRSALCWNEEIAELARLHNNANICALPARFIKRQLAAKIVEIFIKTDFEGGRHIIRTEKIKI